MLTADKDTEIIPVVKNVPMAFLGVVFALILVAMIGAGIFSFSHNSASPTGSNFDATPAPDRSPARQ